MAKKPTLDATSRPESKFSSFAKSYRQSENVEDRRGKQHRPTETPRDFDYNQIRSESQRRPNIQQSSTGGGTGRVKGSESEVTGANSSLEEAAGSFTASFRDFDTETPSKTRKVDAEEAIRRTHTTRY